MPPKKRAASTAGSTLTPFKRMKNLSPPVVTAGKAVLDFVASYSKFTPSKSSDTNSDTSSGNEEEQDPEIESLTLTPQQTADLVAYCRHLEGQATQVATGATKLLSTEKLLEEASKMSGVITRGIEKQMKWKPACKTNSAAFSFEGICANPVIMAKMLGVPDARAFKAKKFTTEQLEEALGVLPSSSARYNNLYVNGNTNLKWDAATGMYKWTGRYGISSI